MWFEQHGHPRDATLMLPGRTNFLNYNMKPGSHGEGVELRLHANGQSGFPSSFPQRDVIWRHRHPTPMRKRLGPHSIPPRQRIQRTACHGTRTLGQIVPSANQSFDPRRQRAGAFSLGIDHGGQSGHKILLAASGSFEP